MHVWATYPVELVAEFAQNSGLRFGILANSGTTVRATTPADEQLRGPNGRDESMRERMEDWAEYFTGTGSQCTLESEMILGWLLATCRLGADHFRAGLGRLVFRIEANRLVVIEQGAVEVALQQVDVPATEVR